MIILGILALCAVLVAVGALVRGGFRFVDFFVFPAGRHQEVPTWLVLLLIATCLGAVVFLQHSHP
jgi:hypothetical protein